MAPKSPGSCKNGFWKLSENLRDNFHVKFGRKFVKNHVILATEDSFTNIM